MSGKYTWKLVVTAAAILWAVITLIPFSNTDFKEYLLGHAKRAPKFQELVETAEKRTAEKSDRKETSTFFLEFRRAAEEQKIDLAQFFPDIESKLDKSLVNLRKKNVVIMDEILRRSRGKLQLGLDLRGGVVFVLEIDRPPTAAQVQGERQAELSKAIEIIGERVDAFGVTEPVIRAIGENRIEVQLAGISTKDNPDIVDSLKKPAKLEFRLVNMLARPNPDQPTEPPPGYEVMTLENERGGQVSTEDLYIKRIPEMTGKYVKRAGVSRNQYGNAEIQLEMTSDGADRFAEVTKSIETENQRLGRSKGSYGQLAIVLDGKLYSAPSVEQEIRGGRAVIYGSFTDAEAFELANVLNNPLDVPLKIVEMNEVGPSLAQDAISSGVTASVIGAILVIGFMLVFYFGGGVVAVVALAVNVLLILGSLAFFHATLSMPGLAGIVLTMGMAVDSNILIYERLREELAAGKTLKAAFAAAHERAATTIIDANLTTLITSLIMIWFGTGPVKGFGVTLTIGIATTMFCALIVSKLVLEWLIDFGIIKNFRMLPTLKPTKFDFMKWARNAFLASWVIVLIGVVFTVVKWDHIFGIDFTGGEEVILTYTQRPDNATLARVANELGIREYTPLDQTALGGGAPRLKIQVPEAMGAPFAKALSAALPHDGIDVTGTNVIGAAVSSNITWNALMALGLSLVGITIYVAFRFEIGYGVGAVVSTVHDVLIVIGLFVLTDRQFSAPMVAAILLIVGYSINDTIVVFDRIREELTLDPNARLRDIINRAINLTLTRTVVTGATTLLTALSLYIFGTGVINDLAFTFLVGVVTGTFSSIFIASPIFYWWHKGDRKHVEAHHDIAPKYEWSASSRAAE